MFTASLLLCSVPAVFCIIVTDPPPSETDYKYAYDIEDPSTGDSKSQHEVRRGDVVTGAYSVVGPDGTKRIVEYTADSKHGFNAILREEPAEIQESTKYTEQFSQSQQEPTKYTEQFSQSQQEPTKYTEQFSQSQQEPIKYTEQFSQSQQEPTKYTEQFSQSQQEPIKYTGQFSQSQQEPTKYTEQFSQSQQEPIKYTEQFSQSQQEPIKYTEQFSQSQQEPIKYTEQFSQSQQEPQKYVTRFQKPLAYLVQKLPLPYGKENRDIILFTPANEVKSERLAFDNGKYFEPASK